MCVALIQLCIHGYNILMYCNGSFHPLNLLMGTVSMMDNEVLFPTSFDAVMLNSIRLQSFSSGSRYDSVSVILKISESFDVRFVICK